MFVFSTLYIYTATRFNTIYGKILIVCSSVILNLLPVCGCAQMCGFAGPVSAPYIGISSLPLVIATFVIEFDSNAFLISLYVSIRVNYLAPLVLLLSLHTRPFLGWRYCYRYSHRVGAAIVRYTRSIFIGDL